MARPSWVESVCWARMALLATLLVAVVWTTSCAREVMARPAAVEEIHFTSDKFSLVGDLRLPAGKPPFPLVIIVHGSGALDRYAGGGYLPWMERMQRAGYATFSWDKPGTGESTGVLDGRNLFARRAQIVLDAIQAMKARADIDPARIGLAGASQAGYVMPWALRESQDVAFMICVSCPGHATVDQMSYLTAWQRLCNGVEEVNQTRRELLLAELDRTRTYTTYEGYVQYRQVLRELTGIGRPSSAVYPGSSQAQWEQSDPANESFWDPMSEIEQSTVPILAFFGSKDTQVDPYQGAAAYERALAKAGNAHSRVMMVEGANHVMVRSATGCMDEVASLKLGEVTFASEFLDTVESWLVGLYADGSPR